MTRYVEGRREAFGVEPICRALGVAVSTHYARRSRKPSRRELPDRELLVEIEAARSGYRRVYGTRKKWVCDITYLRTWSGFLYLAFILDCYSRMIVGWQLATHMRTELVLDALEMANGLRRPAEGLISHSDRGSQYTSIRYTDRLDELGAASPATSTPSTRSSTGSASTTRRDCTKHSTTYRPPSTST